MASRASTRLGLGQALLIGVIQLYRFTLAYLMGGRCRFFPSCSRYALTAVHTHGAWRGSVLTAGRLLRCHPWHPGGVDPVPVEPSRIDSQARD